MLEQGTYPGACDLDDSSSLADTFFGKLRHFVPTLYYSLFSLQRDHLDSFFSGDNVTTETNVISKDKCNMIDIDVSTSRLDFGSSRVIDGSTTARVASPLVSDSIRDQTPSPHPKSLISSSPSPSIPLFPVDSPILPGYGEQDVSDHSL